MKYNVLFYVFSITISCSALIKAPEIPQAKKLIYDPANSNHFYVIADVPGGFDSEGERVTAFESCNGGISFTETSLTNIPQNCSTTNPFLRIMYSIVIEENNGKYFSGRQCILRSENGGRSWRFTNYKEVMESLIEDSMDFRIDNLVSKHSLPYQEGYFTCRNTLMILTVIYGIIILLFFWRTGWLRTLMNLVKSFLLIIIFYFIMGYVYNNYQNILLVNQDHFGIFMLMLFYLSLSPIALITGFVIFAVTAPATIDIFRCKKSGDTWQKNRVFLIWEFLALIVWLVIFISVLQCLFSML